MIYNIRGGGISNVKINCFGEYNIFNALATFAACKEAGFTDEEIKEGLLNFKTKGVRQNLVNINGYNIFLDCFNASVESIDSSFQAVNTIPKIAGGKLIAILGPISQIKGHEQEVYSEMASVINRHKPDVVIFNAEKDSSLEICNNLIDKDIKTFYSEDREEVKKFIKENVRKEDLVLLKGSRDTKMETLIDEVFKNITDNKIVLYKPEITNKNGKSRLTCKFKRNDRPISEIWFEVSEQYEKYLVTEHLDAFLVMIFPWAMRHRHNLICEGAPVSAELLYNLRHHLIPILTKNAKSKNYGDIKIFAEGTHESLPNFGAVGTGMSCGVDSFDAALSHIKGEHMANSGDDVPLLTHLAITSIGSFEANYSGLLKSSNKDKESRSKIAKEQTYKKARKISEAFLLPLIESDTNFYKIGLNFVKHHTYYTCATVLAMKKFWKTYFFASTYEYQQFSLKDHEIHDVTHYDLLLINLLSTRDLRFYSEGATKDRVQKTSFISKSLIPKKFLHVCILNDKNCGTCMKCRRTLLTLDLIGELDEYREVFPVQYYKDNIDTYIQWIAKKYVEREEVSISVQNMMFTSKYEKKFRECIKKLESK